LYSIEGKQSVGSTCEQAARAGRVRAAILAQKHEAGEPVDMAPRSHFRGSGSGPPRLYTNGAISHGSGRRETVACSDGLRTVSVVQAGWEVGRRTTRVSWPYASGTRPTPLDAPPQLEDARVGTRTR
jgi:hypothetical protein